MKKQLFWKILPIIVLAWLFLWLWFSSVEVFYWEHKQQMLSFDVRIAYQGIVSVHKITGKVKMYMKESGKWEEFIMPKKEESDE